MRVVLPGLALVALLSACGATTEERPTTYTENARRAHQLAMRAYEDGDCLTAEPLLSRIRSEYPYSRFAALAELRLADCHGQQNRYIQAIRAYRSFVRARPAHPEVPYAYFKIAESYYKQIPSSFFLSPPSHQRDQTSTREARTALQRFINDYPESERVNDARDMLTQATDLLATHELYVADFYLKRDVPGAAVERLRTLRSQYPDSGVVPQAILMLGRVYLRMREVRLARRTFQELVDRFPDDGYADQARSYLSRFER